MSAISSYAQACKRLLSPGSPDQTEELLASLNQVSEQADRAAEIIRRLRRFVTKAKPSQVVVDLNALIRDVAELMNIDARMAKAEVALRIDRAAAAGRRRPHPTRTSAGQPDAQRFRGHARIARTSSAG